MILRWRDITVVTVVFLTFSFMVRANSASFVGMGSHVYPVKEHNVALRNEELMIRAFCSEEYAASLKKPASSDEARVDEEPPFDQWEYQVTYTLQNTSDNPTSIQVGFPDMTGTEFQPGDKSLLLGFNVTVDGHSTKTRRKKGAGNPETVGYYQDVITWMMDFLPGQTRTLHIRYRTLIFSHNTTALQMIYMLEPGSLWKNGIERFHMVFQVAEDFSFPYSLSMEGAATDFLDEFGFPLGRISCPGGKATFEWTLRDFYPRRSLSMYFYSSPANGDNGFSVCDWVKEQADLTGSPADSRFAPRAVHYSPRLITQTGLSSGINVSPTEYDWVYGRLSYVEGCLVIVADNGDLFEPSSNRREAIVVPSGSGDSGDRVLIDTRGFLMQHAREGDYLFGYNTAESGRMGDCFLGPEVEVDIVETMP